MASVEYRSVGPRPQTDPIYGQVIHGSPWVPHFSLVDLQEIFCAGHDLQLLGLAGLLHRGGDTDLPFQNTSLPPLNLRLDSSLGTEGRDSYFSKNGQPPQNLLLSKAIPEMLFETPGGNTLLRESPRAACSFRP